jgi:hypothetical protein
MKSVFQKIKQRNPAELVAKCHQAFVRLPYESNPERVIEEIARVLVAMKVGLCGCMRLRGAVAGARTWR